MSAAPAAGVVRARVLAARRAVAAVRATESLFLATAAGLATSAAAVLSGAAPGHPHAVGAAALAATACGLTWWLETRPDAHAIARRIDRRLALRGALTTAFELEAGTPRGGAALGAGGELAELLCARVAARVTRENAIRAVLPSSAGVLALPFLAAALLALARRAAEPAQPAVDLAALAAGLGDRAAALGRAVRDDLDAGRLAPDEARALAELVSRARGLETALARAGEAPDAEALDRLRRDLELAAAAAPRASESARRAAEAGVWADAARAAAAPRTPEARPAPAPAPPGAPGNAGGPGVPSSGGGGGRTLTADGGQGMMSGSNDGGGHAPDASGSSEAHEPGVIAGRSWPAHHDALVARWVEARRAAAAPDASAPEDPPEDR